MEILANKNLNEMLLPDHSNLPCENRDIDWARQTLMYECTTLQDFIDYEEAIHILNQYNS